MQRATTMTEILSLKIVASVSFRAPGLGTITQIGNAAGILGWLACDTPAEKENVRLVLERLNSPSVPPDLTIRIVFD